MKKARQVIDYENLPPRLPLVSTIVAYLFLAHLDAAGWVWGVIGTFFALLWLGSVYSLFTVEKVDVIRKGIDK